MKNTLLSLSLLLSSLLVIASPALAIPSSSGAGCTLELVDEYNNPLPTYYHQGGSFVLGQYNARYNVRITNQTNRRVEAVLSVDGRDAVSGRTADYVRQRGYVIEPYGSVIVDGFRQNLNQVAAFRFTTRGDSYAARMGSAANVGVIGVALFPEQAPVAYHHPWPGYARGRGGLEDEYEASADAAPAAPESRSKAGTAMGGAVRREQRNNLGTRYGESRYSGAVEVPFVRGNAVNPDGVLAVYYDDARGLAARGIAVYPQNYSVTPEPFPQRRFAPSPP